MTNGLYIKESHRSKCGISKRKPYESNPSLLFTIYTQRAFLTYIDYEGHEELGTMKSMEVSQQTRYIEAMLV